MSKKFFQFFTLLAIAAILVGGCTLPWQKKAPAAPTPPDNSVPADNSSDAAVVYTNDIRKFNNYEELKNFLANQSAGSGSGAMMVKSMARNDGIAMPEASLSVDQSMAPADSVSGNSGSVASSDYSTTNNQVEGVDEADIIKTDGNYIYALVRKELFIISAGPTGDIKEVSRISFKSRPQDIFINGNSLAVFGADDQVFNLPMAKTFKRQNPYTFFMVFDISDRAKPQQVRDLKFEGYYRDARMIGNYAYLITNNSAYYNPSEPILPRVIDKGEVMAQDCAVASRCFAPDVYYFDINYNSYNYTSVTAINMSDNAEAISGQVYLMDSAQNLYASARNLYLTYTEYISEYELEQEATREIVYPSLSEDDKNKISQIESAPDFILNAWEKKSKTLEIIQRFLSSLSDTEAVAWQTSIDAALKNKLAAKVNEMEKTVIHKIEISGSQINYKSKGQVPGQVLNQFSMDENGDYFRIATTRSQAWSRLTDKPTDSYSNIYVLDADLQVVGKMENIATSERIYSVRFMGDRVYVVTFKQTDPLFVIGLSDPTKPEILGAVKLPGFSTYLHPVDKNGNKLLGFGRDTSEEGEAVKVKGLKLTLFDLTDLSKPREADSYLIGDANSDSIALYDHKAFLYSAEKNLLSIPAVLRDNGRLSFAGVLVFNLSGDALSLRGRIDHSEGGHFGNADYWDGFSYYDNSVKRSLYINDNLYTFSNKFLKVNALPGLAAVKTMNLTPSEEDYIISQPTPEPQPLPADSTDASAGSSTPPAAPSEEIGA